MTKEKETEEREVGKDLSKEEKTEGGRETH